jgi:hypothetical protein
MALFSVLGAIYAAGNTSLSRPVVYYQSYDLNLAAREPGLNTWTASYKLNLIGKDKLPFRQQDWPNPREFRQYREFTQAPIPSVPIMFPFDWGYQTRNWYQSWVQSPQRPSAPILPLTFDWGTQEKPTWYQSWVQTPPKSSGIVAVPFNQFDWPLPRDPRDRRSWEKFTELSRDNSLGVPFKQLDWPLARDPRDKRSWEWNYNLNLIGKDVLPFNQKDWPTPQKVSWYQTWVQAPNSSVAVVVSPLNQLDWPNPSRLSWYQSWSQSPNVPPVPYQLLPFDWGYQEKLQWYRDWSANLLETTLRVTTQPFSQLDWPLPRGYPRPDEHWATWYNLNLIGKDQLPTGVIYTDRPGPVQWYREWAQDLLQSTLTPAVVFPFNQFDWKLPYPVQWFRDLNQNLVLIVPSGAPPFSPSDFPLPYPVRWYQDFSQNLVLGKVFAPPQILFDTKLPPPPVTWYQDFSQNIILLYPPPPPPPPVITPIGGGRVPKDYPHTWEAVPPAYRSVWKNEFKGFAQEIHEAASRLGRAGGIASGKSRRK